MNISETGLRFLMGWEGFVPTPYNDGAGNCTVGYGELLHLGRCTAADMARPPLTEAEGLAQLRAKVQAYVAIVNRDLTRAVTQAQFDALVDFTYNLGEIPEVFAVVNAGGDPCAELNRYIHDTNNQVEQGLVDRRAAECAMYHSGQQPEEDQMWHRLNGVGAYWRGRWLPNGLFKVSVATDFPNVPATASAIDAEVFVAADSPGQLVLRDADGHYAHKVGAGLERHAIARVVLDQRQFTLGVENGGVTVEVLGITGYYD